MIIQTYPVDTNPGAPGNNPFTPPAGFIGSQKQYAQLVNSNLECREALLIVTCIARRLQNQEHIHFCGPYADTAIHIALQH